MVVAGLAENSCQLMRDCQVCGFVKQVLGQGEDRLVDGQQGGPMPAPYDGAEFEKQALL